jgi:hypothetical protein
MVTDQIQEHIPKYLTSGRQAEVADALRDFENRSYYTDHQSEDVLQGDGWAGLEIVNFSDGNRSAIKGVVLSNSCDISTDNRRDVPPRLIFAPLVPLAAHEGLLKKAPLDEEKISSKIRAMRKQQVSSIFYLPSQGKLDREYIALLDDVHNLPFAHFEADKRRARFFTLSQMAFYLFVLKLSIHFCRFQERIDRDHR